VEKRDCLLRTGTAGGQKSILIKKIEGNEKGLTCVESARGSFGRSIKQGEKDRGRE